MSTELLMERATFDVTENRVCHILDEDTGLSLCGCKEYTPHTEHTWDECKKYHTQCTICMHLGGFVDG